MKIIIIISSVLLLYSCAPVYLIDKTKFNDIPKGSTKVIASVSYSRDSLYSLIGSLFAKESCPVHTNKEIMQIYCDGKSIEGGTLVKPYVLVEGTTDSSTATFTGEWGLNADGQIMLTAFTGNNSSFTQLSPVIFERKGTTKSDAAFQYLVNLANKITGANITYSK